MLYDCDSHTFDLDVPIMTKSGSTEAVESKQILSFKTCAQILLAIIQKFVYSFEIEKVAKLIWS